MQERKVTEYNTDMQKIKTDLRNFKEEEESIAKKIQSLTTSEEAKAAEALEGHKQALEKANENIERVQP